MAVKKKSELTILLPSLALSGLVFVLIVVVMNIPKPQRTTVFVEAAPKVLLSESDEITSLEQDLILLQADDLATELRVVDSLE